MRTNYVLIDFENVQPTTLAGLDADHFRLLVFVGANQNKLAFETAAAVQKLGSRADYIKITGNGSNALDFHIAFHIGRLSQLDPDAFFHIVSKDTGFDPLIAHLKERKVFAARSRDVSEIPLLKAANSKNLPDRASVVVSNLRQRGASRPRTLKTLTSTIQSLFQKQLSDVELAEVLDALRRDGVVVVTDTKVSYSIPPI